MLIREQLADQYPELLTCDGLDDAILGVVERCGFGPVVCYDFDLCVKVLMRDSDMDEETASEFLEFNTVGAYVGPETPMFLRNWRVAMADPDWPVLQGKTGF